MKRELFLFVLCCLLLSALPTVVCYGDAVVERPIYSEGDHWIFVDASGRSTEWKFLREEKDKYVFSKDGSEVVKDFNLMEMSKTGGFPGPMVKFPLKKGNWWNYEFTETSHEAGRSSARIARYEAIEYERITVAAGTFWAFKISVTIDVQFFGKKGSKQVGSATYWYAPEVKQIIKGEKGDRRWELKEYKIK